ncbi:serine acetyltransferase [Massilia oculi]|uniref:Serine acetyltransferase n=1 Tax=Massilia hydrophila TaxID=3044279 RepID=A0ABS7Y6A6_9BURK|nr:serine acetyltransferase [Massilia oculi]
MSLKFFVSDLKAASRSSNFLINAKWFLLNHSIHIVFFYRLGQSAARVPIFGKLLRFVVEYAIRVLYASDISCLSKIGEGLIIVHGHDIVIGADVVIGRNCKIFNGVTLGNKDIEQSSKGNQPTLGDHVVLSTGAKLLGPIEIGSYVTIGANSVVLNDCPSRSVVVGVPARVVKKI